MAEKTEYIISLKDLFSRGINEADSSAKRLDSTVSNLRSTIAKIGATIGFAAMAKGIFDAGTNMEGLNISLKTMLGSKEEADKLIAQMVNFAATTPFSQSEVQTAGKQLLAYGIEAKNIIPTLRQLGDVSAGLNQPIGEIAYLYGTIKTQGKAMTVDIRQFANRGIPIYEELAKVTGKTGEALQKYIEDGKIGFPEIQKAFENMSGVGGKFANLTSELAKTTGGQWSNTKDQLEQLAVTIFKELQPAINWFISGMQSAIVVAKDVVKWLSEHALAIKVVAASVTTLVVAMKAWSAITNLISIVQGAKMLIAIVGMTAGIQGMTTAQYALNAAMSANPIGIVILALSALAGALMIVREHYKAIGEAYSNAATSLKISAIEKETEKVKNMAGWYEANGMAQAKAQQLVLDIERQRTDETIKRIGWQLREANIALQEKTSGLFGAFTNGEELKNVLALQGALKTAVGQRSILSKDIFTKGATAKEGIQGVKGAAGIDSAKTPEHKVITINIDKLIEKFTIATNTVSEGAQSIKEQVVKALIEAVNDSQIILGV